MRLPDESGNGGEGGRQMTVIYAIGAVSLIVLLILVIVITGNNPRSGRPSAGISSPGRIIGEDEPLDVADPVDDVLDGGKLRPGDLDFWDMYPENPDIDGIGTEDVLPEDPVDAASPTPIPPAEDGRHTLVERRDGSSEWIRINPYITRNTYDPLGFVLRRDHMGYYENEKLLSTLGVDLSRHDGRVDFNQLKNADIDFVMLRLGARGYESGQISVDDNFYENLYEALQHELDVGVYFFSQAISAEEAIEEANVIIEALAERKISYPIVFNMDYIPFDRSRIDTLTRAEKTEITDAFCNYISGAGYVAMIYGTKEWLIEQIDLAQLMAYDVWLSQPGELPDYPYKFQMWQYSHSGNVPGTNGNVSMDVCFVDYGAR